MKVRTVMDPDPPTLLPEDPVSRAGQLMRDTGASLIPVVFGRTDRRLMGFITDRDIALRHVAANHWIDCAVEAHMSEEDLPVVGPDDDTAVALEGMRAHALRGIPVVENGRLVGMLAYRRALVPG